MKISFDVYTRDAKAATAVLTAMYEAGCEDARLNVYENGYETGDLCLNLMGELDHKDQADILTELDEGPFVKDTDDL
jgi:hypothetical protein